MYLLVSYMLRSYRSTMAKMKVAMGIRFMKMAEYATLVAHIP
jgi:hypothetical protein